MPLLPPTLLAQPTADVPEPTLLEHAHVRLHEQAWQALAAQVARCWDNPDAWETLERRITDEGLGQVEVRRAASGHGWSVQTFRQPWVADTLEQHGLAELFADEVAPAAGPLLVRVRPDPLPMLLEDPAFRALARHVGEAPPVRTVVPAS